jgi:hypothetical protein
LHVEAGAVQLRDLPHNGQAEPGASSERTRPPRPPQIVAQDDAGTAHVSAGLQARCEPAFVEHGGSVHCAPKNGSCGRRPLAGADE